MNSNKKTLWIIGGIIGVYIAFALFMNYEKPTNTLSVSLIAPSDYYLRPSYGYLKCEQVGCNPVTKTMGTQSDDGIFSSKTTDYGQIAMSNIITATPYTCQDFIGINEGCQITLQTINGNIDGLNTVQQLDYQQVPFGSSFNENQKITLSGGSLGYDDGERAIIQMGKNDVLYVRFAEGLGAFDSTYKKINNKMNFIVSGTCFGLIDVNDRSSTSGQQIAGNIAGDCLLRDSTYKNAMITFADPIFGLNSQELDWVNLNAPHRVYTYLSGLEPAPFVFGNVQTYNGQFVFCQKATNTLYKIAPITAYGKIYQSVVLDSSGVVGTVNCCEGDQRPNQVCQNNQWITITQAQCDLTIGKFCPEQDWIPYGNLQVRRFSCVNNQCVPEVKSVTCNFNMDCPNGQVCQRGYSPFDNKCVLQGTGDICGDNICSNTEYKAGNCLKDCPPPPSTGLCTNCLKFAWNWISGGNYCTPQPTKKILWVIPVPFSSQQSTCPLFLLIMGGLIFLFGMLGFRIYKNRKGGVRKR